MEANKKELHEGVAGNGDTTWVVATVDSKGNWIWQEVFKCKAEAEAWIKYA